MIRVVLLEDIGKVGEIGDVVSVKNGFARNFLIPAGKARRATPEAIAEMERRKGDLIKQREERLQDLERLQRRLDGFRLEIDAHASADGKLYGSIGPAIIADRIAEATGDAGGIGKDRIRIVNQTIKHVGDHEVVIAFAKGLQASVTVSVRASGHAPRAEDPAPGTAGEQETTK